MQNEYYFIENGKSSGPYSKDGLKVLGLKRDTLVWRQGMADWVKAETVSDLADIFEDNSAFGTYAESPSQPYFAMINGTRVGPASIDELISKGLRGDTPVWRDGMADWENASNIGEIQEKLVVNGGHQGPQAPPYYGQRPPQPQPQPQPQRNYGMGGNGYNHNQQYPHHQGAGVEHTNWLPWAIAGTVAAFLFSCIGIIFGIIGIVQANKANSAYAMGDVYAGDSANSSAKTMTIISLVFAGLGLLGCIIYFGILGAALSMVY